MSTAAIDAKNRGNTAFQQGNFEEAVKHFTEAIRLDANNHVLYSNRSAAYASLKKWKEALDDANKTVELKPDWGKGYSRKGTALHGLEDFDGAALAYSEGLKIEPNNEQLKQGLADVNAKRQQFNDPNAMFGQLFGGDIWTKIRSNPKTAKYLDQPDFVNMVTQLQKNPSLFQLYSKDPRMTTLLGVLLGISIGEDEPEQPSTPPPAREPEKPKEPPKAEPVVLSNEERKAEEEKNKGNELYKNKNFEGAIKHYNTAMELYPNNITYLNNRAAVYLEMGRYDECIADCNKAVELGRQIRADYKHIGKAFQRLGNVYMKQEKYDLAVEAYNKSLMEDRTPDTLKLLQKAEKIREEKVKLSYLDPQKSLEAKERGNQFFKDGKFPEAIREYTESIQRKPDDPVLYSNRAAAYMKLAEYHLGLKDCEKALELKPDFVKAHTRKGHIYYFLKEYQKALEAYDAGLKYEENNQELTDGVNRTLEAIRAQQSKQPDKETIEQAMKNPEVQEILSDPVMRQILEDMQSNPGAAANHMKNPLVMSKIQKLVAAGILQIR